MDSKAFGNNLYLSSATLTGTIEEDKGDGLLDGYSQAVEFPSMGDQVGLLPTVLSPAGKDIFIQASF